MPSSSIACCPGWTAWNWSRPCGRHKATPIIYLTTMSGIDDRVRGLEAGGDDYLIKPFAFEELLAQDPRHDPAPGTRPPRACSRAPSRWIWSSAPSRATAARSQLLPQEFLLLEYLLRNADRAVTRKMLLENVWDIHFDPQHQRGRESHQPAARAPQRPLRNRCHPDGARHRISAACLQLESSRPSRSASPRCLPLVFLALTAVLIGTVLWIVAGTERDTLIEANESDIATVINGLRAEGIAEAIEVVQQRLGTPAGAATFRHALSARYLHGHRGPARPGARRQPALRPLQRAALHAGAAGTGRPSSSADGAGSLRPTHRRHHAVRRDAIPFRCMRPANGSCMPLPGWRWAPAPSPCWRGCSSGGASWHGSMPSHTPASGSSPGGSMSAFRCVAAAMNGTGWRGPSTRCSTVFPRCWKTCSRCRAMWRTTCALP